VTHTHTHIKVPSWFHAETSAKLENMVLKENDVVLASWPK
jgi:hypothetical protein